MACGLASPVRRCQGLVYLGKNRLETQFEQTHELGRASGAAGPAEGAVGPAEGAAGPAEGAVAPPSIAPGGNRVGPGAGGERCPPAPLVSAAPRPRLAAPALMRSIKRIIDVEVCCEVPAAGKRGSAADTGALICTTWLKPESRHFINGFSLC